MLRTFVATLGFAIVVTGATWALGTSNDKASTTEQWVNANLLRVRIQGRWESFPMVALSERLCESGDDLFERYCGDRVLAPSTDKARGAY